LLLTFAFDLSFVHGRILLMCGDAVPRCGEQERGILESWEVTHKGYLQNDRH